MQFSVLGPLEVVDDGYPVNLGGTKQRATLGYLLLQPNRVVSTSQLLDALWAVDDAPVSARKILQNAVWGLRRALTPSGADEGPTRLVTQPPGYKLSVDPADVDLYRFQDLAARGREALAAGQPEEAAALLRQALELWRGPALSDLVETGIGWPELSTMQNARLNAMEDYFDAELALGRHHAVLGDLKSMVEDAALRERSSGQLMIALYRSGCQAEALNVYQRVRTALVEELGLEPGRALQALQQAILNHDPMLDGPVAAEAPDETVLTAIAAPAVEPRVAARPERPVGAVVQPVVQPLRQPPVLQPLVGAPAGAPPAALPTLPPPAGERPAQPRGARDRAPSTRRQVSVLLIRTQFDTTGLAAEPEAVDESLESASRWIHQNLDHFGGQVTAAIGSILMALFESDEPGGAEAAAERAVLAALATQDGLRSEILPVMPPGVAAALSFRAAIVTGEAMLRYQPGRPPSVNGTLLNSCDSLLALAGADEIRVCDRTRTATESMIDYRPSTGQPAGSTADSGWRLRGIRPEYLGSLRMPTVEREAELSVLAGFLERARRRATPHVVTVLGDPGIGKTRFLTEFGRMIRERAYAARVGLGRAAGGADDVFAIQRELVRALGQVGPEDSPELAREKVTRAVRSLVSDEQRVARLTACLDQYVDPEGVGPGEELEAWRRFLETTVLDRPLVLLIDDLHRGDEAALDFVAALADFRDVPLLVVVTARSELLELRPEWGGGKSHVTTLTLDPLSDAAVDELLDCLLPGDPKAEAKDPAKWFRRAVRVCVGSGPDERRRYVRSLLSTHAPRRARAPQSCRTAS